MAKMTENSRMVLNYLKEQGVGTSLTIKDIQAALGFEKSGAVVGSLTGLAKKELVEKFTTTVELEDGKTKEVKCYALNEAGMAFDPDTAE